MSLLPGDLGQICSVLAQSARAGHPGLQGVGIRRSGVSAHRLHSVDGLADDIGVSGVLSRLGHDVHEHPTG